MLEEVIYLTEAFEDSLPSGPSPPPRPSDLPPVLKTTPRRQPSLLDLHHKHQWEASLHKNGGRAPAGCIEQGHREPSWESGKDCNGIGDQRVGLQVQVLRVLERVEVVWQCRCSM
ncbi:UNVERIFIED_CONTAM: hypothetical protein FKN15_059443 [Acipenser sinensis]